MRSNFKRPTFGRIFGRPTKKQFGFDMKLFSKALHQWCLTNHLCTTCHCRPAQEGLTGCADCKRKRSERTNTGRPLGPPRRLTDEQRIEARRASRAKWLAKHPNWQREYRSKEEVKERKRASSRKRYAETKQLPEWKEKRRKAHNKYMLTPKGKALRQRTYIKRRVHDRDYLRNWNRGRSFVRWVLELRKQDPYPTEEQLQVYAHILTEENRQKWLQIRNYKQEQRLRKRLLKTLQSQIIVNPADPSKLSPEG